MDTVTIVVLLAPIQQYMHNFSKEAPCYTNKQVHITKHTYVPQMNRFVSECAETVNTEVKFQFLKNIRTNKTVKWFSTNSLYLHDYS